MIDPVEFVAEADADLEGQRVPRDVVDRMAYLAGGLVAEFQKGLDGGVMAPLYVAEKLMELERLLLVIRRYGPALVEDAPAAEPEPDEIEVRLVGEWPMLVPRALVMDPMVSDGAKLAWLYAEASGSDLARFRPEHVAELRRIGWVVSREDGRLDLHRDVRPRGA